MKNFIVKICATVFYTGYIPLAPGTFGTLWGIPILYELKHTTFFLQIFVSLLFFVISILISELAVKESGNRDPSWVVIDEVCGYVMGGIFIPLSVKFFIIHFVLFRFFDILKPFPIRTVENKVGGGLGVVLDDVVSGIISGLITSAFRCII